MADKKFDLVVYGATGFTGKLVVEYLSQQYPSSDQLKWAMAGRSIDKLRQVRDELGVHQDIPLVVADAEDHASMQAMVNSARVVLTTVGPYQLYGSQLVQMCASSGTDYVDLCGEPVWMHQMIKAHEQNAKNSGARIVFSCGFDSVPFDMGVLYLQQAALKESGKALNKIRGRVRKMKGTFSGGTGASFKATFKAAQQDKAVFKLLVDPFSLTPDFRGPEQPFGNKPILEEDLGSWSAPFVMATVNTKNIHRSNLLMSHQYGEDFIYDEMLFTGPGERGQAIANQIAQDKSFASEDGPKPGEGPSKEAREAGCYDVLFIGELEDGSFLKTSVSGDLDPGYGSTCKMISECALCLLDEAKDQTGGIWTPASAFGDKLIARLQANAGLRFQMER